MAGKEIKPYEIEILTKKGKRLPFEVNAVKIIHMGKPADMVILRDLRQRKKKHQFGIRAPAYQRKELRIDR